MFSFARYVGIVIRNLRQTRKMTEAQLAVEMGSDRAYISRIECGRIIPSISSIERVAKALQINILVLFLLIYRRQSLALFTWRRRTRT